VRDQYAKIVSPNGLPQNWLLDLRKICLDPVGLEIISSEFWDRFKDELPFQVGGLEIGSIPIVSAIQLCGLRHGVSINGFFVHKERKSYGLSRTYEGTLTDEPAIIVDDTFNSGMSAEKVRVILAECGVRVASMFAIVDYENTSGARWLVENRVKLSSLFKLEQFGLHQSTSPGSRKPARFREAWRFERSGRSYFEISPGSTPAVDGRCLYFGSDNGEFWALDQGNGTPKWCYSINSSERRGIRSSPALFKGSVYFGSRGGNVHCLATETGSEQWRFSGADSVDSSPSIAPELGKVFVGLSHALPGRRGSIAALRLNNGEKLWEFSTKGSVSGSPAYEGGMRLLACGTEDGELLLFDPESPKLLWRSRTQGGILASAAFDNVNNSIVVGTTEGFVYSISVETGESKWLVKTYDVIRSTPLIVGNQVFVTSTDKNLYIIESTKGRIIRKMPTRGKNIASPSLINGSVFFGSTSGVVYEIDPETGIVKAYLQLPDRVTDRIVYGSESGMFFARTYDGRVFAFHRADSLDK
jgi:outer membrane protein assembly factor BamB